MSFFVYWFVCLSVLLLLPIIQLVGFFFLFRFLTYSFLIILPHLLIGLLLCVILVQLCPISLEVHCKLLSKVSDKKD